jgi:hypothetical protein
MAKRDDKGDEPPLRAAWRADADQLSHEESEIEPGGVNQQPVPTHNSICPLRTRPNRREHVDAVPSRPRRGCTHATPSGPSSLTGRILFVFVVVMHQRRQIVHVNVTEHPTATWAGQQLIEAFPDNQQRHAGFGEGQVTTLECACVLR